MSHLSTKSIHQGELGEGRLPSNALVKDLSFGQRLAAQVSASSFFRDDVWDFSVEIPTRRREHTSLSFAIALGGKSNLATVGAVRLLDSMKCLAYSLIFDPPRSDLGLSTISKAFKRGHGIGNLYWYLAVNGFEAVSELTELDFLDLLEYFRKQPIASNSAQEITNRTLTGRLIGISWLYQQREKLADQISFKPWSKEGTCGRWAIRAASKVVSNSVLATQPWSDGLTKQLLEASLAELRRAPQLLQRILDSRVEKQTGTDTMLFQQELRPINPAADLVFEASIKGEYVRFRSSVALLVGCLTGMRCSELLTMLSDPVTTCRVRNEVLGEHQVTGYFIVATLRKHQPVPKQEEWQTAPIAHHAIALLAEINLVVSNQNSPFLLRTNVLQKSITRGRELAGHALVTGINRLAKHYCVDLSEVGGNLSAMDLRRSFARLVTRSGLGLVELQSQLKHIDPGLTMKYGAPSQREYLAEEKENWTRDQYAELVGGDDPLIGGGSKEMEEKRVQFAGLTRLEKDALLKALPKQALIDQVGDGMCLYRPDRALCGGEKINCRPAECGNSVLRLDEVVKTLRFRRSENERLLVFFSRQPAKRAHLKVQIATVTKLLDQAELKLRDLPDA